MANIRLLYAGWGREAWKTLSTAILAVGNLESAFAEAVISDKIDIDSQMKYKVVLGGYYLISISLAGNRVIEDLYNLIKGDLQISKALIGNQEGKEFYDALRYLRKQAGADEFREPVIESVDKAGFLAIAEGIAYADKRFMMDGSRLDKVNAIESIMHIVHTTDGIFQYALMVRWGDSIMEVVARILDWMAVK